MWTEEGLSVRVNVGYLLEKTTASASQKFTPPGGLSALVLERESLCLSTKQALDSSWSIIVSQHLSYSRLRFSSFVSQAAK
ncbi:hypothetical protein GNE08_26170 [Trichormus variabilis ARAD]|nr:MULTISPECIES: hypothetical protein [Nostocaceae]MBC1217685.1 hypothetical protein [Trichormus variabilis ARAD]MBC1259014.1 hypothetical protein [Trichormus variabilis V5]MBC1269218.1 hypothetical protein [Trichormus variabilis FSR]MBC1301271.1 hypothetical protein [Trichormus variabilis N2B]MBC1309785.1 hypothetical protein [Trichormus variabilis PNB]